MKKIIYSLSSLLILSNQVLAATETENINSVLKSSGYEPNYFSVVLSLIFVVFLIYVTGILYTKLNKVGVNTIKKEFQESSDIKPVITDCISSRRITSIFIYGSCDVQSLNPILNVILKFLYVF